MDINQIKNKYEELNNELKRALSSMEHSDRIFQIRDELKDLQKICSHKTGDFDFTTENKCPYCGKRFKE